MMANAVQIPGRERDAPLTWDRAYPWIVACGVAAVLPFAGLLLWQNGPEIRHVLTLGDENEYLGLPFLGNVPVRGASKCFLLATAAVYWIGGTLLFFARKAYRRMGGVRAASSSVLSVASFAILIFVVPLLAVVWALALKSGVIPGTAWGVYQGNHGPWRYFYNLRHILHFTFAVPFYGALAALISGAVRPSLTAAWLIIANAAAFLGLLYTHYWLVD